jgi:hypothetical protein
MINEVGIVYRFGNKTKSSICYETEGVSTTATHVLSIAIAAR